MMKQTRIYVIYDGIENSVFPGQVLEPIRQFLQDPSHRAVLISYEKLGSHATIAKRVLELNSNAMLLIKVLYKLPFLGKLSLWYAIWQLRTILRTYDSYELVARGPLAGYLCLQGKTPHCSKLTIQARGLLAEEYRMPHVATPDANTAAQLTQILRSVRYRQFHKLEKAVYSTRNPRVALQAVSPALKDYLVTEFDADPAGITVADHDIPHVIVPAQRTEWRTKMRKRLRIPKRAYVYCYNGSIKAWQCPELVVSFFNEQLTQKTDLFLLVLTQDCAQFKRLLEDAGIPTTHYAVHTVAHQEIYQYLSACDAGLLFRQPHIVNWTSRPTKLLEYQAVGLEVVHNGTVGWLVEKTPIKVKGNG